jgi:hypothetical protein
MLIVLSVADSQKEQEVLFVNNNAVLSKKFAVAWKVLIVHVDFQSFYVSFLKLVYPACTSVSLSIRLKDADVCGSE